METMAIIPRKKGGHDSSRTHVPGINQGIVSKRALVIPVSIEQRDPSFGVINRSPSRSPYVDRGGGGVHARFHKSVGARGDRKRTRGRRIERRLDVRRCSTRNAGIYLPNYHGSLLVYRGGSAEFNGS